MLEPAEVLAYLAYTNSLGDLCNVSLSSDVNQWTISLEELRTGGVSSHLTREILLAYSTRYPDIPFGSCSIPVVCCIKTLRFDSNAPDVPLLCIGASLDPNGTLVPQSNRRTWIPQSALNANELFNDEIVVCDLDAYRAHQVAMASLPVDGTWATALSRAEDLFAAVCTLSEETLRDAKAHINESACTLVIWERPEDSHFVSSTLSSLAHEVADKTRLADMGVIEGAFGKIVLNNSNTNKNYWPSEEQLPDDPLLSPKLLCGIPDHLLELGPREHEALATFERQQREDVLLVDAPTGTNYPSFVMALIANALTTSALRGDPAPFMCCVAPPDVLENIVRLIAARPLAGQVALESRWIPRIDKTQHNAGDTSSGWRTLGPLPALFLSIVADGAELEPSNLCIVNRYAHNLGGELASYRDPWYIPKATTYFLDCVSGFTKQRFHSVGQARARLADTLRRIDQERCELIDAYSNVCKASELLKRRDDLVARIGRLRRGHTVCKERLAFWQELMKNNRPRMSLRSNADQDQSRVIAQNAQRGETIAQGKSRIEDVCDAYSKEILRIETSIDRLRGAAANLNSRIRAAAPEGTRCSEIIERLTALCRLTQEQKILLDTVIDGRGGEVSLSYLQGALDKTVRPAEFWLSIHIFESCWITFAHKNAERMRLHKESEADLWDNVSAVCPITLIPSTIAAECLHNIVSSRKKKTDITVLLDAGNMDIGKGIALSLSCDRMVIAGSSSTLGAPPSLAKTFDELQCVERQGSDVWRRIQDQGLCASERHSFFEYVRSLDVVESVNLFDTHSSYGELDDLRNDLFDSQHLRTNRIPANSADDQNYALHGIVPSLSYVLVPDSAWRQVGASRSNSSEALALGRWLSNHANEIFERYTNTETPIAVVSPFKAQTQIIKKVIDDLGEITSNHIGVHTLCSIGERSYPLVILCATCGPEGFENMGFTKARHVLSIATSSAMDALVLFCGGAWIRSTNSAATSYFTHASRVGRLFSSPRKTLLSTSTKGIIDDNNQTINVSLRSKPLSVTTLIKVLSERGDISYKPSAKEANAALADVGLIERVKLDGGKNGWRPTAAGREVGIVSVKDRNGNPFCAYPPTTEAVISTVLQSLGDDTTSD